MEKRHIVILRRANDAIQHHFKFFDNYNISKNVELGNYKAQITSHLKSANDFLNRTLIALSDSKKDMIMKKNQAIKSENSRNAILLIPFSFAILFALLSIVTNIIWGKYIPRIPSIILCILFYILSIQVIIISTYFAYNIPENIFTQEPEYFKLFDFEMTSFDKRSTINAYKTLLACNQEKSLLPTNKKPGIHLTYFRVFPGLFHEILESTRNQFSDLRFPHAENITELRTIIDDLMSKRKLVEECLVKDEEKRNYIEGLAGVAVFLDACMALQKSLETIENSSEVAIEEVSENRKRTIRGSIKNINQTLINADFQCQPLYNALLNGYISSYQPDENLYREMFKITVMGCSTLCLVLYLLALGRRINQTTCDSRPPKEYKDSNKKSRKAKKNVAPRSPKRI